MKQTLKKAVSLLLSVLMIVSVCTMAISVSAEEVPTFLDFGIIEGTGTSADKIVKLGDEYVIKMGAMQSNYNLKLADPANPTQAMVMTAGVIYTVKFDYMLEAAVSFSIRPMKHPTADKQRGDPLTTTKSGISNDFVGDGKWHTGTMTFTGKTPTGGGVTLDNIAFLHQCVNVKSTVSGYLKNITVIVEDGASTSYGTSFNTDMKAHIGIAGTAGNYGSGMSGVAAEGSGNLILGKGNSTSFKTGSNEWVRHRAIIDGDKKYHTITPGVTYTAIVKYRVNNIVSGGWICLGVGYAKSGTSGTGDSSQVGGAVKITDSGKQWRYLTVTFTPTLKSGVTSAKSRIILSSSAEACSVEIESVQIFASGMPDHTSVITYNDNGTVSREINYKGTSIVKSGANQENLDMGESFMGWYSSPTFEPEALVTEIPETATTLYARYPSVILDTFEAVTNYTAGNEMQSGKATVNADGTLTATSDAGGSFRIPAYDAPITTGAKFPAGVQFRIKFYYNSVSTPTGNNANPQFIPGERYGDGYKRVGSAKFNATLAPTETPGMVEQIITNQTVTNSTGELVETLLYRGGGKAGDAYTSTIVIDKIIITALTEETVPYASVKIAAQDGDTTTEFFAKVGDIVTLPEPKGQEGMLFIGYYSSATNLNAAQNKSENLIPVSVIRVTSDMVFNTVSYVAKYISTEEEVIDFTESKYDTWTDFLINSSGARAKYFKVVRDDETGESYAYFNSHNGTSYESNIFKMSLYSDAGKELFAYEGVTYDIEIVYDYINIGSKGVIGISRNKIYGYMPYGLDTYTSQGTTSLANKVGSGTATTTATVKNTYTAISDIVSSGVADFCNQFSLYISSGEAKVYSVKIKPVSYTAPAMQGFDATKGNIDIDYVNGTVTVIPNEGYEVSAKGVNVSQRYVDYYTEKILQTNSDGTPKLDDKGNKVYTDTCFADKIITTPLSGNTTDGYVFSFDNNVDGVRLNSLRFDVSFVKAEDTNAAYIAMSKRTPGMVNDKYQSAGIRFRLRASAKDVANATEVGFVFIPKKALSNEGVSSVQKYMEKRANSALTYADYSVSGVAKDATKHVVYETLSENYVDYQVYLTGLTNKNYDDAKNEKMMALEVCVATYFIDAEGNTTYVPLDGTWSYNKVAGK